MRQRFRNKRRRAERQEEAMARQLAHDALSLTERGDRPRLRPGMSLRESLRIADALNAEAFA